MSYRVRPVSTKMPLSRFRTEMVKLGLKPLKVEQNKPEAWGGEGWTITINSNGTCDLAFKGKRGQKPGLHVNFKAAGAGKGMLYQEAIDKVASPHT